MDRLRRRIALLAWMGAIPAVAYAGNGISGITVRHEPNLTSEAVQAIVSGDNDSSAVLRIFQRWRENPTYDTGMVMVRRVGTNIHEGRILWMTPDRTAYFYVEGRDAGGDFTTPLHLARVEDVPPITRGGPAFYVDQRFGNDVWDGTIPASSNGVNGPKRTINAALAALAAAPDAGRNGGVFVAPGEYHERLDLDFGPDGSHHFLEGDGTNRDSTILCGANPLVERGQWAPGHPLVWTLTQDSTYVAYFPARTPGSSPGDSTQLVVVGWGEYVHRKTSLKAVLDDSTYTGLLTSTNAGELSGWFWRNDSLYVKRKNGQSPALSTLHTGYLDNLIDVKRRYWRIANLTVRFAGGLTGDPGHSGNPDPSLQGHGISGGLHGTASGLVVDSCRFYGHNADAIYLVHSAVGGRADSVTIAHCIVDGLTVGRMAYSAGKGHAEEHVGQILLLSRSSSVFDNFITGGFNGIGLGSGDLLAGPRDSTFGFHDEIAYNTVVGVADDAIELDTTHNINTLLFGNVLRDAGHGISFVPTYSGPTWAFYNTIANSRGGGIKIGDGTRGIAWFGHNTITASNAGGWALDGSPGGRADNLHFRNNILVGRGNGIGYTLWAQGPVNELTNDFNFNLLDSLGTVRLVRWGAFEYSLPSLQSKLGWEKNGVRAAAGFVDSARFNWALLPSSAAVGRGRRLTGVNTSLDGPRFKGAPDIGVAQALPPLADVHPPLPGAAGRLAARAEPNPARGVARLEYLLPAAADVSVRLYDPAGRLVRTLLDHVRQPAGVHSVSLQGRTMRPGLYLYMVIAGAERAQGKLLLLH